jgi:hypothetical protein
MKTCSVTEDVILLQFAFIASLICLLLGEFKGAISMSNLACYMCPFFDQRQIHYIKEVGWKKLLRYFK